MDKQVRKVLEVTVSLLMRGFITLCHEDLLMLTRGMTWRSVKLLSFNLIQKKLVWNDHNCENFLYGGDMYAGPGAPHVFNCVCISTSLLMGVLKKKNLFSFLKSIVRFISISS